MAHLNGFSLKQHKPVWRDRKPGAVAVIRSAALVVLLLHCFVQWQHRSQHTVFRLHVRMTTATEAMHAHTISDEGEAPGSVPHQKLEFCTKAGWHWQGPWHGMHH
jgi:hypothetical protein